MLSRLIKYDLKKILKFLYVFMALALFFGVLKRLFGMADSLIWTIMASICNGACISMMCSLLINSLMRSWVTFKSSLYGDESYLTHTLPVQKKTHYYAKAITGGITLLVCMIAVVLILFVTYWSKETKELLEALLTPLSSYLNVPVWGIAGFLFILLFVEFFNLLQIGFMGMILGHRSNQRKVLFSVLISFGIYLLTQGITLAGMLLVGLLDPDFMNVFSTSDLLALKSEVVILLALAGFAFYVLFGIIGFVLNAKLLKKGVNVD